MEATTVVYCPMCGREVRPGRPGQCVLGHPLNAPLDASKTRHERRGARGGWGSRSKMVRVVAIAGLALLTLGVVTVALRAGTDALDEQAGKRSGSPAPTPSLTALQRRALDRRTVSLLRNGLVTEMVLYVDNGVFAADKGADLQALREMEPTIAWGSADAGGDGVEVVVPASADKAGHVVVLRSTSRSGTTFCIASLQRNAVDGRVWYATAPSGVCPAATKGMRGWSSEPWRV